MARRGRSALAALGQGSGVQCAIIFIWGAIYVTLLSRSNGAPRGTAPFPDGSSSASQAPKQQHGGKRRNDVSAFRSEHPA
jgi:hypothetical protein